MQNKINLRGHHIAFIGECINGNLEEGLSKIKSWYGNEIACYIRDLFKSLNFLDIKITNKRDSICAVCSPDIGCRYPFGLRERDRECLEYYDLKINQEIKGSKLIRLVKAYYQKTGSLSPRIPVNS